MLVVASDVAREAGELLLGYVDRVLDVQTKSSATDPVSEADHASERLITSRILRARPDDGILAEEGSDNRQGTSGQRWVIDPLDGTVNFLYGIPQWCVSIACEDEDGSLAGAIYDPSRDELFTVTRGGRAEANGLELKIREPDSLSNTLVVTGFGYDAALRAEQGDLVANLLPVVRDVRRFGSAAIDLAWVAAGRIDAYLEFGLSPWDWAAGQLLVQQAGGATIKCSRSMAGEARVGLVAASNSIASGLADWLESA